MPSKREIVRDAMRQLIAKGDPWKVGDSMGDLWNLEGESEELFGIKVSWGTIRAAQGDLADEGILSKPQQGCPTRVIALPSRAGTGWAGVSYQTDKRFVDHSHYVVEFTEPHDKATRILGCFARSFEQALALVRARRPSAEVHAIRRKRLEDFLVELPN